MKKISLVAIIVSAALAGGCHGKKADNTAKPPAGDTGGSGAPPAGSGDMGSGAGGAGSGSGG
jgi:hypothetical protein